MTTASAHEFFAASAGVAGALIGLLFVAISVAPKRIIGPDASEVHGVRAAAALTAFTNALAVALFGLVPGLDVGDTAAVVAILGFLFIAGALLGILPAWRARRVRITDLNFLIGLLAVFLFQLLAGLGLARSGNDKGDLRTICILVIVCFLIGIARSWELVGGPDTGLGRVLVRQLRARREVPPGRDREED
jgi:hypothetical protein